MVMLQLHLHGLLKKLDDLIDKSWGPVDVYKAPFHRFYTDCLSL